MLMLFNRSLDLDKWNRRQITFMEVGGNAKAHEFFAKHGLKAPFDYKSPVVDKYKQEQTKRAEAILNKSEPVTRVEKPVFVSQKVEEQIPTAVEPTISIDSTVKKTDFTTSNVKIDKEQTKTKGFSVEFTNKRY